MLETKFNTHMKQEEGNLAHNGKVSHIRPSAIHVSSSHRQEEFWLHECWYIDSRVFEEPILWRCNADGVRGSDTSKNLGSLEGLEVRVEYY